jgi:hypothetical protein
MDLSEVWVGVGPILFVAQLAWYVAVTVLLIKIWRKVKHLPG